MRRWLFPIVISFALTSCAGPAPGPVDPEPIPEGWMRTVLDNGLKVVVIEDRSAPVAALMVWVRAGSGDERADQAGMAHVFEHMLFKGTERRGVGEIARTVEAAGGDINAFTSFDATAYFVTMASRDVETGIDVLSDALQHSTFDPVELKREAEVVLEEIRRSNDSPGRRLSREIFELAYRAHPYRLPVIGTEQSVQSFAREHLLEFFEHWYAPNNMTFVVAGDVEPRAVVEQIRSAFGEAEPRLEISHPRPVEPEQSAPRARVVHSEFEQTLLGLAYKSTPFRDPDTAYLDLLSGILGGGDASRLYRGVKDRQRLVHSVSAGSYTPLDAGLFLIDAELDAERVPEAVAALAREIERVREFGPSQAELERARTGLLSMEVHERETMQGQARKAGSYETIAGGIEYESEYLGRIRQATRDDIRRVAREYLAPERANVVALLQRGAGDGVDEAGLLEALGSGSASGADDLAGEELRGGIRRYVLPNGLRLLVKPISKIPLVSMRLAMLGGQLAEEEETQGISSFLAEMLERGSEQRSAAQIAAEVEDIAGSLRGFSGRNSFGLEAEFLRDSLDTGLELFADVLLRPGFDAEEFEKLRVERLDAIARREDNLASKAFELLNRGVYAAHPYGFLALGTPESVRALDRDRLRAYYARYAHPSNAVLAVVGDVEPDSLARAAANYLSDWSGPERVELPRRPAPRHPDGAEELSLAKNKNQIHMALGFPGLALGDPDGPALDVLTQTLSGQGGRLFLELRDRQSLAYSVAAFSLEGVDPGLFGVYIATAPEKLEQARGGLRAELEKLLAGPIRRDELDRARDYLIGTQAVALQRYGHQAMQMSLDELYGLGAAHYLDYASDIEGVGIEEVERVARRVIDLDASVYALVR